MSGSQACAVGSPAHSVTSTPLMQCIRRHARQARRRHARGVMLDDVEGLLDGIYLAALLVALWGTGLGLGMSHAVSELVEPARRPGLMLRVAVVDVVALPLLVWALVRVLAVPGDYAIGLLLVGVASAGPLGIKAAQIARRGRARRGGARRRPRARQPRGHPALGDGSAAVGHRDRLARDRPHDGRHGRPAPRGGHRRQAPRPGPRRAAGGGRPAGVRSRPPHRDRARARPRRRRGGRGGRRARPARRRTGGAGGSRARLGRGRRPVVRAPPLRSSPGCARTPSRWRWPPHRSRTAPTSASGWSSSLSSRCSSRWPPRWCWAGVLPLRPHLRLSRVLLAFILIA